MLRTLECAKDIFTYVDFLAVASGKMRKKTDNGEL